MTQRIVLAKVAYEAYAQSTGGKTWDGRDMPTWEELPGNIQTAWEAAITEVKKKAALQFLEVFGVGLESVINDFIGEVQKALEEA